MYTFIMITIAYTAFIICGILLSRSISKQLNGIVHQMKTVNQKPGFPNSPAIGTVQEQIPANVSGNQFVWSVDEAGLLVKIPRSTLSQRLLKMLDQ
jgi:hypothetical protein